MLYKGEIITACDPDLNDMYACEVVRGDEENTRNILCRVLYMISYPIQHAILDGSVPNENPPLAEGTVCRLKFVARHTALHGGTVRYDRSFVRCLEDYRKRRQFLYEEMSGLPEGIRPVRCPDPREFEILARHARGEFEGKRVVLTH